jgi:hypothetical protein
MPSQGHRDLPPHHVSSSKTGALRAGAVRFLIPLLAEPPAVTAFATPLSLTHLS